MQKVMGTVFFQVRGNKVNLSNVSIRGCRHRSLSTMYHSMMHFRRNLFACDGRIDLIRLIDILLNFQHPTNDYSKTMNITTHILPWGA